MNSSAPRPAEESTRRWRLGWLLALCCLVLLLAMLSRGRRTARDIQQIGQSSGPPAVAPAGTSARDRLARLRQHGPEPAPTATEIVSNKVVQFARQRRDILERMARKLKQDVPDEVKRFF